MILEKNQTQKERKEKKKPVESRESRVFTIYFSFALSIKCFAWNPEIASPHSCFWKSKTERKGFGLGFLEKLPEKKERKKERPGPSGVATHGTFPLLHALEVPLPQHLLPRQRARTIACHCCRRYTRLLLLLRRRHCHSRSFLCSHGRHSQSPFTYASFFFFFFFFFFPVPTRLPSKP